MIREIIKNERKLKLKLNQQPPQDQGLINSVSKKKQNQYQNACQIFGSFWPLFVGLFFGGSVSHFIYLRFVLFFAKQNKKIAKYTVSKNQ